MTRRFAGGRLVVATHNRGKLGEIAALLDPFPVEVVSAAALGLPEPAETEETFVGNARIKAHAAAAASGLPALADDSGIEVDALGGAPGVHTADWAELPGGGRDFHQAMRRTWAELEETGAPAPRTARFRCTLVLAWPDGHDEVFEGAVEGQCVWPMRGDAGPRLRSDVPARRSRADLRSDGPGREEPHQPPRPAPSSAWSRAALPEFAPQAVARRPRTGAPAASASMCTGRSAPPNAPTATSTATSAPASTTRPLAARAGRGGRGRRRGNCPGRVVDTVFFGGGTPSLMPPETVGRGDRRHPPTAGRSPPTPRSPSRPTRPRSRPAASAATATPGSTASPWACRR